MEKNKLEAIESTLSNLEKQPFPLGIRSLQFEGKNISVLQSEILGAMHTIVATHGEIGTRLRNNFNDNIEILTRALAQLNPEAKSYFTQIVKAARLAQDVCRPLE